KNGNLSIPKRYVAGNGKNLGIWLQHQREGRRKGMLANWQVRLLDGIGMIWESGDPWEQGFSHAIEYFRENGDLNVPNQYSCVDGYRLGKWISNQRFLYGSSRGKEPGEERIQRLNAIGMIWSAKRGRRSAKKDF
ncbi:MAG: helicase associated domain-containing protein, partial [Lachnospiraceae bacterium]|nr:helicase associated domain-containing protein [Lachnospiraceae bacterium]